MNQTEIDELRERIDAAISTVCNGMAAMSIPADPRDVDLVLADCAKALAALEEARAERYTLKEKLAAMDLLLNNAERVVRDGIADRDAAETQAWDALGRPDGTHDTSNVQRLCEAHGATKAELAEARAERLGYRTEYLELLRRIREGQLVTATEASLRYEVIIEASSEEPL